MQYLHAHAELDLMFYCIDVLYKRVLVFWTGRRKSRVRLLFIRGPVVLTHRGYTRCCLRSTGLSDAIFSSWVQGIVLADLSNMRIWIEAEMTIITL